MLIIIVRRYGRRGNSSYSNAIHSQGLCHSVSIVHPLSPNRQETNLTSTLQDRPDPPHNSPQLHLLLQRFLPNLDPKQLLGSDGLDLRCARLHASNLLEAKILPSKPPLPVRIHPPRGVRHKRRDILLRIANRRASAHNHPRPVRRAHSLRMSDEVRLHELDAVSFRCVVVFDPLRVHGFFLPDEFQGGACVWRGCGARFLGIYSCRYAASHETLSC